MIYRFSELGKWVTKAKKDLSKEKREIILRLFRAVIMDTPVLEGTLRGNWQCSVTHPKYAVIENRSVNDAIREIETVLNGTKLEQTVFLRNNLPYAAVVEYGLYPNPPKSGTGKTVNGFSRKAPAGMVRKNAMRFSQLALEVRRGSR